MEYQWAHPSLQDLHNDSDCVLIPPKKLTWQWKTSIFDRRYIFKWLVFHCHVSLPGCNCWHFDGCKQKKHPSETCGMNIQGDADPNPRICTTTLPKFNIASEKLPKPNRKVVFQPPFFRGYVKLREGIISVPFHYPGWNSDMLLNSLSKHQPICWDPDVISEHHILCSGSRDLVISLAGLGYWVVSLFQAAAKKNHDLFVMKCHSAMHLYLYLRIHTYYIYIMLGIFTQHT